MTSAMSSGSASRPVGLVRASTASASSVLPEPRHCGVGDAGGDGVDADAVRGQLARHAAREPHDAQLARHVGGGAHRAAIGRARRQVDDHAGPPGRHHAARRLLGADERALEIGVEHGVPLRLVQLEERRPGEDAGVVHEDVDRSEAHARPRPRDAAPPRASRRRRRSCSPAAERGDLGRGGLRRRLVVEEVERHVGALPREAERDGAPDAALRARDEDDLPGAPVPAVHDSATMGLRSVPIPLISTSMTSPGTMSPSAPSVPIQRTSPGWSVVVLLISWIHVAVSQI